MVDNTKPLGIMYMVFGARSSAAAQKSYESIREFHDIPAMAVGDHRVPGMKHVKWTGESPWAKDEPRGQSFYAGRVKPFLYNYSQFERTLYLDADTLILKPILDGFDFLDDNDVVIADDGRLIKNLFKKSKQGPKWDWLRDQQAFTLKYLGGNERPDPPSINTGVIFFRKSHGSESFMANWYEEWCRIPKWDEQMPFLRAERNVEDSSVIKHIDARWNSNNRNYKDLIIYHYWGKQGARDLYDTDFEI